MRLIFILILVAIVAGGITLSRSSDNSVTIETNTTVEPSDIAGALDAAKTAAVQLTPATDKVVVYDGISVPKGSIELDVSGRGLSGSLKAEVRLLTNLTTLDLSDNNFTGVPAEVGQLSKLVTLDLSNNPLTGLPYEIGNLQNLQTLDLRGTQYAPADLVIIQAALPASTQILVD